MVTREQLIGAWRLVSYTAETPEGETVYPVGQEAAGYLLYSADGHMSVCITGQHRPNFAVDDRLGARAEEKLAAFDTCVAYAGRYEVRPGNEVVHRVEVSLHPNRAGTAQVRYAKLEGDRLSLTTPPRRLGGRRTVSHLVWERAGQG